MSMENHNGFTDIILKHFASCAHMKVQRRQELLQVSSAPDKAKTISLQGRLNKVNMFYVERCFTLE